MALEVYYPQDIRNALLAAEQASSAALLAAGGDGNAYAEGYQAGYRAALATIALAFGLADRSESGAQKRWRPAYPLTDGSDRQW